MKDSKSATARRPSRQRESADPSSTTRRVQAAAGEAGASARPTSAASQAAPPVPIGAGIDAGPDEPTLPTAELDLKQRRMERIAIRAREIYEARGGAHGQDLDDWLQAEREIDADLEERTLETDDDES